MKIIPLAILSFWAGFFIPPHAVLSELDVTYGQWWKDFLTSAEGNAWFDPWNIVIQAKLDELSAIAEAEEDKSNPFRVLMVGDSTMKHQFGAMCGFLGENRGSRFDTGESQQRSPGCCIDTVDGGGRGLCFEYEMFRFLNPERAASRTVDAYYFGCGLHLLHMTPSWPGEDLEPLRVQEWLYYENLLQGTVEAVRRQNGPDVKIAFMTSHVIADEKYTGDFAQIFDAYRVGAGNETVRAECNEQIAAAAADRVSSFYYFDWKGGTMDDIDGYIDDELTPEFAAEKFCEYALMDRRGSLELNRRARLVMANLDVPLVDAGRIVEGHRWATRVTDGRHYHPLVPLELIALLEVLTSPPPPPSFLEEGQTEGIEETSDGPPSIAVTVDVP